MQSCPTCGATWTEGESFCPFDGSRLIVAADPIGDLEPTAPDPWLGLEIDGRYRLEARLGSGGMGFVYRAKQLNDRTEVAIKILRDSEAANEVMVERFRREAESATRVGHPGIIRVLDFGVLPSGAQFMVMELLEGSDLAQRIARRGIVPYDTATLILLEACEALEAAHRSGIVHRDLKPENLFIARLPSGKERLKVVDFGLAKMSELERPRAVGHKLTRTGTVFGTPKYMAPEQGMGKPVDVRTDVYALGCIGYEMLTGKAPFDGENYLGIVNQHLFDPPPPFAVMNPNVQAPPSLEAAIMRALAKKPRERHPSMEDFGFALSRASGVSLPPPLGSSATPRPYVLAAPPPTGSTFPPAGVGAAPTRPLLRLDEPSLDTTFRLPTRSAARFAPLAIVIVVLVIATAYAAMSSSP